MRALADLVKRARAGSLRSSEMSDPTITVTNLGEQGVEAVYGVIYPPQVALVGFGRIAERAWAEDGALRAAPLVTATLSGDHRASDGHAARASSPRCAANCKDRRNCEPEELNPRCWILATIAPSSSRASCAATRRCAARSTWTRWTGCASSPPCISASG